MKILAIQLFVIYSLIYLTSGQCPSQCFCLGSSVTCSDLTSFPKMFPTGTLYIIIRKIDVEEIPAGVFNRLPLLESISINDGRVGKISTDAFQSLSAVEFITLSELSIGTIESYAFNNFTDTGSLSLETSTIDLIQPYAFFDMFALDELKVSYNNLKYIDSFAFNMIDELLEFSFQNNNVETMKPYAFSQFSNLYRFSMYLNTLGSVGCGSFETLLYQTDEQSFYSNTFNCTCNIVWASNDPSLKRFLFSSSCQLPETEEKINWSNVSIETVHCTDIDKYECPSEEYLEMLIPNIRIPSPTTGANTRQSSSTASPPTPSSTEQSPIFTTTTITSTEVETETTSDLDKKKSTKIGSFSTFERITDATTKIITTKTTSDLDKKKSTITGSFSTFERITDAVTKIITTKTSTTKLLPTTTPTMDINIESPKSVPPHTNPKVVIINATVELKPDNNSRKYEAVSVIERNGAKMNSLLWIGMVTAFTLTVI